MVFILITDYSIPFAWIFFSFVFFPFGLLLHSPYIFLCFLCDPGWLILLLLLTSTEQTQNSFDVLRQLESSIHLCCYSLNLMNSLFFYLLLRLCLFLSQSMISSIFIYFFDMFFYVIREIPFFGVHRLFSQRK